MMGKASLEFNTNVHMCACSRICFLCAHVTVACILCACVLLGYSNEKKPKKKDQGEMHEEFGAI